jgi:hypothetical protein
LWLELIIIAFESCEYDKNRRGRCAPTGYQKLEAGYEGTHHHSRDVRRSGRYAPKRRSHTKGRPCVVVRRSEGEQKPKGKQCLRLILVVPGWFAESEVLGSGFLPTTVSE